VEFSQDASSRPRFGRGELPRPWLELVLINLSLASLIYLAT